MSQDRRPLVPRHVADDEEHVVQMHHSHGSFGHILRAKIWWIILIGIVVIASSATVYPILPRSYEATSLVFLQPTDQNGQPGFGHSTLNALDENQIQAYNDILGSRPLLMTVIQQQHLIDDPEFNPTLRDTWYTKVRAWLPLPAINPEQAVETNVRKRLVIRRDKKSYIMQVGFWSANPETASAMANILVNAFVTKQLADRQHYQRDLVNKLAAHVTELQARYHLTEAAAHTYLVDSGLIHKDQQTSAEHQLTTLSNEYAMALSRTATAEEHAQVLAEMQKLGTLDSAPDVLASPIVSALKERLITLTAGTGVPGSIGVGGSLPASLAELRQLINTEIQRIVRAAQAEATMNRLEAVILRDDIAHIDAQTVIWREAERHLSVLQRESDADQKALQDAMAQLRTQTGLIDLLRPDTEVWALAVPPARPAFPNLMLYTIGTLLLTTLLSGIALLPTLTATARRPSFVATGD